MSRPSWKCRKDSDTRLALARSEYRTVRAGLPANRTALVTSSETRSSAVAAVSSLIPRQEPRNERVYRRAQNGEVGSVTKANIPASSGRGCPDRADCQADPVAGPTSAVAPPPRAMACPVIAGYLLVPAVENSRASPKGPALLAALVTFRQLAAFGGGPYCHQTVKTCQTLQTVQTRQTVRAGQTVFAIMAECHLTAHPNCRASALRPRYVHESMRVNGSHRSDCPRWQSWPPSTAWRAVPWSPRSGASRPMGLS